MASNHWGAGISDRARRLRGPSARPAARELIRARLCVRPAGPVALHKVAEQHSGVASSLLNTAQQVGGAIVLAVLGTVAWTTVADSVSAQVARAAADAAKAGQP